jgi:phosphate transport system permease protein
MNVPGTRTVTTQLLQIRSLTAEQAVGGGVLALAALCVIGAAIELSTTSMDVIAVPLLALLFLALAGAAWYCRRTAGTLDREMVAVCVLALISIAFLLVMPEWFYGHDINAIIHRSFFDSVALAVVGTWGASQGIYLFLGGTPSARDISRYPIVLLPVVAVAVAYTMILGRVVDKGIPNLTLDAVTSIYRQTTTNEAGVVFEGGLRNQIIGSVLHIILTVAIALPIGVGAGMYIAEYPGIIARVITISAQMLRAISLFIIGSAAVNMVLWANHLTTTNPFSELVRGVYSANGGYSYPGAGSMLLGACFVSLLVIPVIARATEEGLRSVPREIREGSMALGATDGHGLLNIYLPWAFPVILTGVFVGAAEAAGATAIMVFVAGTGEYGVGPLHPATTLDVVIFQDRFGSKNFMGAMGKYQYTAAFLLLMITLAFTSAALWVKARAWRKYKGVYTT